jgi:hypothetical protein
VIKRTVRVNIILLITFIAKIIAVAIVPSKCVLLSNAVRLADTKISLLFFTNKKRTKKNILL